MCFVDLNMNAESANEHRVVLRCVCGVWMGCLVVMCVYMESSLQLPPFCLCLRAVVHGSHVSSCLSVCLVDVSVPCDASSPAASSSTQYQTRERRGVCIPRMYTLHVPFYIYSAPVTSLERKSLSNLLDSHITKPPQFAVLCYSVILIVELKIL